MAPNTESAYELVDQHDAYQEPELEDTPPPKPRYHPSASRRTIKAVAVVIAACFVVFVVFQIISNDAIDRFRKAMAGAANGMDDCPCRPSNVPQHFQTRPQLWPGPTLTGQPAFLAQTVAFKPSETYVPNEPLVTSIPIQGMTSQNQSIFNMMGLVGRISFSSPLTSPRLLINTHSPLAIYLPTSHPLGLALMSIRFHLAHRSSNFM